MVGKDWQIVEGDDFERSAMGCGGLRAVEEVIAPIKYALSKNPLAFPPSGFPGVRLAKTQVILRGGDIVMSHSVRFRVDDATMTVTILWVEITPPDDMDWDDDPF